MGSEAPQFGPGLLNLALLHFTAQAAFLNMKPDPGRERGGRQEPLGKKSPDRIVVIGFQLVFKPHLAKMMVEPAWDEVEAKEKEIILK